MEVNKENEDPHSLNVFVLYIHDDEGDDVVDNNDDAIFHDEYELTASGWWCVQWWGGVKHRLPQRWQWPIAHSWYMLGKNEENEQAEELL